MGYGRFKTCALTFWGREKVKEWMFLNTSWKFFKIYETYQATIIKMNTRQCKHKEKTQFTHKIKTDKMRDILKVVKEWDNFYWKE